MPLTCKYVRDFDFFFSIPDRDSIQSRLQAIKSRILLAPFWHPPSTLLATEEGGSCPSSIESKVHYWALRTTDRIPVSGLRCWRCCCGIPSDTLHGSAQSWESVCGTCHTGTTADHRTQSSLGPYHCTQHGRTAHPKHRGVPWVPPK
jgi:hypothetical protein